MTKPKILIITSTVREGRVSRQVAEWYLEQAEAVTKEAEFELLDIKDLGLPLFNEPVPPVYRKYGETQNKLAEVISDADGFVFITGEYNYSVPGSLKIFLDYIYAEWGRRPASFVGYGVHGGVRAIQDLGPILSGLGVPVLSWHGHTVHIDSPWEAFDDKGTLKDGYMKGDVKKQLDELAVWTNAFKGSREQA